MKVFLPLLLAALLGVERWCPRPQASKLAVAVSLVPLCSPPPPWRPQACPDTWTSLEPLQGWDLVSLSFRVSSLGPRAIGAPSVPVQEGCPRASGSGLGAHWKDSST